MAYIFGDLGRSWSTFRDLGSKGKILLGSQGNYFQGSGEINALFSGIKGAQTPPPPGGGLINYVALFMFSTMPTRIDSDKPVQPPVALSNSNFVQSVA